MKKKVNEENKYIILINKPVIFSIFSQIGIFKSTKCMLIQFYVTNVLTPFSYISVRSRRFF